MKEKREREVLTSNAPTPRPYCLNQSNLAESLLTAVSSVEELGGLCPVARLTIKRTRRERERNEEKTLLLVAISSGKPKSRLMWLHLGKALVN